MPNRYIPRALSEMMQEEHGRLLRHSSKGAEDEATEEYVPEYEALVNLLAPEHREEFRERHNGASA